MLTSWLVINPYEVDSSTGVHVLFIILSGWVVTFKSVDSIPVFDHVLKLKTLCSTCILHVLLLFHAGAANHSSRPKESCSSFLREARLQATSAGSVM